MKMRGWIAILLLLNVITLAWQWDAFGRWGWGPNVQREPQRLQQQIKPEALQFTLPGQEASAPAVSASEASSPLAPASSGKSPASEASPAKPVPATAVPSGAASAPVAAAPAKSASQ